MRNVYGIYGASGFGKEVLPLLKRNLNENARIYFIDDNPSMQSLNGHKVLTFDAFLKVKSINYFAIIAIAESKVRELLTEKCLQNHIELIDLKAENVLILDDVEIGKGSILCPFVTLTSNIKVGKSFHANLYSYVAHDCTIGDYVTFAPGVKCNGNIKIENHVYIGTGAIIKQGKANRPLVIGAGATIAAGAVVTKNIPAGITVFGNPAIALSKENLKRRS